MGPGCLYGIECPAGKGCLLYLGPVEVAIGAKKNLLILELFPAVPRLFLGRIADGYNGLNPYSLGDVEHLRYIGPGGHFRGMHPVPDLDPATAKPIGFCRQMDEYGGNGCILYPHSAFFRVSADNYPQGCILQKCRTMRLCF